LAGRRVAETTGFQGSFEELLVEASDGAEVLGLLRDASREELYMVRVVCETQSITTETCGLQGSGSFSLHAIHDRVAICVPNVFQ